ncbi:MAG: hypothetical protein ABF293_09020 [Flavobacteriaceae bacterium]
MAKYFLLTLCLLVTIGCTDRDDDLKSVNIRVHNVSDITFDIVRVGGEEKIHENVAPDSYTSYLEYEEAYRYASIQIEAGTEFYGLLPFDFVGETPLPIGLYTYELDINEEGEVLLNFVVD